MAKRDAVFPASPHTLYADHGYSPAVRAGDLLFVSGQVGARADGTPEPDLADEVALAFANLRDVLAGAGCTPADVIDVQLFTTDPNAVFPLLFAHHPAYWGEGPLPALTAAGVTWLAGFRFEIKVVARLAGTGDVV
ncbi:Rid family hydrolase [Sphingomonas sp. 2R-10]|uniref:Rid family hydrolase n=1 Tax=Sphingomonas sp. 2R-10 TaxID=3045148 RepID=UPI000F7B0E15|nr:Rid family hydrolase [Sphingomonas sp. 2R-10]MDJ0276141.1 Rid family hydrolase [Sphingomonas sp. 2R-10]